jgi:hypothetical protein
MRVMKLREYILLTVSLLALGACRPTSTYFTQPQGPPEYKLGWEDGCDTGVSSTTDGVTRLMLGFKKRPEFGDNEMYKSAWNEGFTYCRLAAEGTGKNSPWN